jgi:hypothetical protein
VLPLPPLHCCRFCLSATTTVHAHIHAHQVFTDADDRSSGLAKVVFAKRRDAEESVKAYDGRLLDQRRLELALQLPAAAAVSSSSAAAASAVSSSAAGSRGQPPAKAQAKPPQSRPPPEQNKKRKLDAGGGSDDDGIPTRVKVSADDGVKVKVKLDDDESLASLPAQGVRRILIKGKGAWCLLPGRA